MPGDPGRRALPNDGNVPQVPQARLAPPSIAVLAFENMSSDPDQEYFSDGIAEDLITALSKLSGLLVIARNSTFTYKGKPVKVQQVGRDLGVRYVLEGSVRKAGDRVRITAVQRPIARIHGRLHLGPVQVQGLLQERML
jgi:adenylate cyclase